MKNVIIYTTPTCGFCHMAKEYLKSKGIEYKEYDVSSDEEKAKEMIQKSGQMGVPVIIIKDEEQGVEEIIVGFDQARIDSALQ